MNESLQTFLTTIQTLFTTPFGRIGETDVTLFLLAKLCLWVVVVLIGTHYLRRCLIERALRRTRLDAALQYGVSRIIGYLCVAFGIYLALSAAGMDLSSLAIVAGAVGVGIGFGLQDTVNNFVGGLIILAERPITIGDRVEVGGVAGQVKRIGLRSTTVVTNDNISIIVPNADLVTELVTNWSHGDPKVRVRLPVGVAYGSDVPKLRRILLEVAAANPAVLQEPPPTVFFIGFGDSSLDFELGVWTVDMARSPRRFNSDLYFAIEDALRKNGIEIPFPQRDLHLRSGKFVVERAGQDGTEIRTV